MRISARLLAATAAAVLVSSSAMAADVVIIPPLAPAPPPVVEDPAFAGPYWGVYGGVHRLMGPNQGPFRPAVGTQFGYNFAAGSLRLGFEVETEYFFLRSIVDATLNGRVGVVLGSNILLYGQAGIGTFTVAIPTWSVGGGVEFAVGPHLALFGEGKVFFPLGGGGPFAYSIRGGVNYYADRDNLDAAGAFDWGGLYFGTHVGRVTGPIMSAAGPWLGGVQVGYNLGGAGFVGGAEVETSYTFGNGAIINAALNGRAGFAFGPILVYGELGIGSYDQTNPIWTAGGGAELALGTQLGLFAEAKAIFNFGGAGGVQGMQINGGMNIHFGR